MGLIVLLVSTICVVLMPALQDRACAAYQILPDTTAKVDVREPDPERIEAYKNQPEFTYDDTASGTSIIGMLISEILRFLDGIFGDGAGSVVLRVIFVLLLAGVILLVVNQMMAGNIRSALTGKSASESIRFGKDPSTQHHENLAQLINNAVKSGNYREAVRLHYQKTLKELGDAGLIEWATNKTNHDYIYELESHPASDPFRKLTRIYEYTEYGDFGIGKDGYRNVTSLSRSVNSQIRGGAGA
mgnify:CR=1 FL=1